MFSGFSWLLLLVSGPPRLPGEANGRRQVERPEASPLACCPAQVVPSVFLICLTWIHCTWSTPTGHHVCLFIFSNLCFGNNNNLSIYFCSMTCFGIKPWSHGNNCRLRVLDQSPTDHTFLARPLIYHKGSELINLSWHGLEDQCSHTIYGEGIEPSILSPAPRNHLIRIILINCRYL